MTEVPGAPPAVVARNPILARALGQNERFQRLTLRLEDEMREFRVD